MTRLQKERKLHLRKPLLLVADKAVRNTGKEGLVLERQERGNLKIIFGIIFVPKQGKCDGDTHSYFLIHLQNLLGETNKKMGVQQSKDLF